MTLSSWTSDKSMYYILAVYLIMLRVVFRYSNSIQLHPYLKQTLSLRSYLPLKKFQVEALNSFNQGKNVMVNSCTGSGKTLAYLVPIMHRILTQPTSKVLILTLNAQLTMQVQRQIKSLDPEGRIRSQQILRPKRILHSQSQ